MKGTVLIKRKLLKIPLIPPLAKGEALKKPIKKTANAVFFTL
jgi:hypothetical protein